MVLNNTRKKQTFLVKGTLYIIECLQDYKY